MEHKNVEEDDELNPQKFGYNDKKKIPPFEASSKKLSPSVGTVKTTSSNFMQWVTKLPPTTAHNQKKVIRVEDLMNKMVGNNENDVVNLTTEDKLCVVLYPPTTGVKIFFILTKVQ